MRSRLFWGEIKRFLGDLLLLAVIGAILAGLVQLGVMLANAIDDGHCIGGLALGDICLIDSLILSVLATLGGAMALTFLFWVLGRLREFLINLFTILTAHEAVLTQWEAARKGPRN